MPGKFSVGDLYIFSFLLHLFIGILLRRILLLINYVVGLMKSSYRKGSVNV